MSASREFQGLADRGSAPGPDRLAPVWAVVREVSPALTARLLPALAHQSRPPDEVLVAARPQDLRCTVLAALTADAQWVWLLDGAVRPEPAALEQLLAGRKRADSWRSPVLLASKVLTPQGTIDPSARPVPQVLDRDLAVGAVERRMVALRVAPPGSLLVHRGALAGGGRTPGGAGGPGTMSWTARLLKDKPGLLVPSSVVVRERAGERRELRRRRADLLDRLRLVIGDALEPEEKPWFAFRLAEDALAPWAARIRNASSP